MTRNERIANMTQNNPKLIKRSVAVSLDSPKVVLEIPAHQVVLSELEIDYFVDHPNEKKVEAYIKGVGVVTIWEGDAYDAIGDWTNADVELRVKEIYN